MLLHETVEQNGQRGEADVVESQVSCVVQRLGFGTERVSFFLCFLFFLQWHLVWSVCAHLLREATEELVEELRENETDVLGKERNK